MFIFRHLWSKLLLLVALCAVYSLFLNFAGQSGKCLGQNKNGECLYFEPSAEHQMMLKEVLLSVRQYKGSNDLIEQAIQGILKEDISSENWKDINNKRLLTNYLRLFILKHQLEDSSEADIARKLTGFNLFYCSIAAILLFAILVLYSQSRTNELSGNPELQKKSATVALNTYLVMLLTLAGMTIWYKYQGHLAWAYIATYSTAVLGSLAVYWRKIDDYHSGLVEYERVK